MDWCTSGGAAAAQKKERFWPKFEIPKNGSTEERTRAGKRFLALAVCSGEQHWPVLEQHGFSGSWLREQKISLMRLVLLDKNCTRQNGILGEPSGLEKWFAYLATLTRKTNSAVVEQHGLVHQWRSSSGTRFWPKFEIPKNGSTDERTRAGKRFLTLAVRSVEQHWPVL